GRGRDSGPRQRPAPGGNVTDVEAGAVIATGATFEVEVGAPAAGGACVARAPDGRVVFVRHTLPGEHVRIVVTAVTKNFLRADAVEVLRASADRVEPRCPYAGPGRCGGCDWQHASLDVQRRMKADLVTEQLTRVARLPREVEVEQVPGAPDGLHWRTRLTLSVTASGTPGLRRHRSHEVVPIEDCPIAAEGIAASGALGVLWPLAHDVEVATTADGRQRVVAVEGPVRLKLTEVDAGIVVGHRPVRVPHGLSHVVRGRRFEVSAGGFWQGHVGAPELLVDAVLAALDPQPGERALDLYAGVGLFAAHLGDRVGADGHVLAIESDHRASADAARNTADQPQVSIRTASVEPRLLSHQRGVDLVVLDPPRTGAGLDVAAALVALRPRRIAYVSCDAASFARDVRVFLEAGWTMPALRAFDAFPMTEHVEVLGVLEPPVG
ncbi:MAG: rRNA methyltransferase/RumA, partial [Frankiales bacterium]|nr:rRNA methyltransferase/RumA [Frankiales bacterium]